MLDLFYECVIREGDNPPSFYVAELSETKRITPEREVMPLRHLPDTSVFSAKSPKPVSHSGTTTAGKEKTPRVPYWGSS